MNVSFIPKEDLIKQTENVSDGVSTEYKYTSVRVIYQQKETKADLEGMFTGGVGTSVWQRQSTLHAADSDDHSVTRNVIQQFPRHVYMAKVVNLNTISSI